MKDERKDAIVMQEKPGTARLEGLQAEVLTFKGIIEKNYKLIVISNFHNNG